MLLRNKKGSEVATVPLIYLIIGVVVVTIVIISLIYFGVPQKIKLFFPTFDPNENNRSVEVVEAPSAYGVVKITDGRENQIGGLNVEDIFWIFWDPVSNGVKIKMHLADRTYPFENPVTGVKGSAYHETINWLSDPNDDKYFLNGIGVAPAFKEYIGHFANINTEEEMMNWTSIISNHPDPKIKGKADPKISLDFMILENGELRANNVCGETSNALTGNEIISCSWIGSK